MALNNPPQPANQRGPNDAQGRRAKRLPYHKNLYKGLLMFVVIGGLPLVGLPSLRLQLKTRVWTLGAAVMGQPPRQTPVKATVGENREPFPREYERAQAQERPSYLPKMDAQARSPHRIIIGGEESKPREGTASAPQGKLTTPSVSVPSTVAAVPGESPSGAVSTDSKYRKGKSEQEAYDLLLSANTTIAGMAKGSDPTLKFQDWAAADMGQESYYVMVTFVQTQENTVRKYIWSVNLTTKVIVPLSAYAREISK